MQDAKLEFDGRREVQFRGREFGRRRMRLGVETEREHHHYAAVRHVSVRRRHQHVGNNAGSGTSVEETLSEVRERGLTRPETTSLDIRAHTRTSFMQNFLSVRAYDDGSLAQ